MEEKLLASLLFNFRVDNDDWIELGELALAFGKSRCYLFSYLVELDLLGFWDALSNFNMNLGAPTHPKLSLKVSWKLNRAKYSFKRAYHVKI
ncbi:MAG TPA: DUF1564 family protein [Leptospiraceae bacterium]|nr:DUF1564 family protein [Leptospiraceae bacterium]